MTFFNELIFPTTDHYDIYITQFCQSVTLILATFFHYDICNDNLFYKALKHVKLRQSDLEQNNDVCVLTMERWKGKGDWRV